MGSLLPNIHFIKLHIKLISDVIPLSRVKPDKDGQQEYEYVAGNGGQDVPVSDEGGGEVRCNGSQTCS